MPRRGSLVGDAYVRIHADSSAVDRELRKEMKRSAEGAGDEWMQSFAKNVEDGAEAKLKKANEAILQGVIGGKPEWDRQFKQAGMSVDDFAKTVEARMKIMQNRMKGKNNLKALSEGLAGLKDWAGAERIAQQSKVLEKAILDQDKAWQTYRVNVGRVLGDEESIGHWKKMQKAIKDQEKALMSYDSNVRFSAKKVEKAVLDQDRAWQTYTDNLAHNIDHRALPALRKFFTEFRRFRTADRDVVYGYSRVNGAITRFERLFAGGGRRFSDIIARSFGKGSRNNFLNFTGGIAGGAAKVSAGFLSIPFKAIGSGFKLINFTGELAFKTMQGFGQLMSGGGGGGLGDAFNLFKQGAGNFGASLSAGIASFAKAGLPGLVAIAVALTAIAVAIPPLLSAIGSLAGVLVAIAGSISIGLVGGLLAAGPVVVAAAAGIGVLVALISNLNDIGKDTDDKAFKPLQKFARAWAQFTKVLKGKPTEQFAKALGEIAPLFKIITPMVKGLSDAIYAITLRFATLFTAKDMQPFIKAWNKTIPKIFEDVGQGIVVLLSALTKFFKPILPFAEKLAHNFMLLMTTFNDWAGSAEGQNAIADFMKTAWERATDVWDILVLLGEAIGGLFSAGDKNAGGDLLEGIKTGLQGFVDWLNSPEGAQALKEFFTRAKTFAESLVTAIGTIATALTTINWEEASQRANTAIEWIGKIIGGLTIAIVAVNAYINALGIAWQNVGSFFVAVYNTLLGPALDLILGAFSGILRFIADMFEALANVPGFGWAKDAADKLNGAADAADALGDKLRKIEDVNVNVNVGLSGPGVALLQKAQARKNPNVFFGASGGILTGPTFVRRNVVGGEAGREALVPLDRPLSMVDPSVRALSAFAQGLPNTMGASGGTLGGGGRSIVVEDGAIRVMIPNSNPELVASSVLDRLVASAVR